MTKPELQASDRADKAASEFVYSVHSWRGRSPEFMQAQKRKLGQLIDQTCHLKELEAVVDAVRLIVKCWYKPAHASEEANSLDTWNAEVLLHKALATLDAAKEGK